VAESLTRGMRVVVQGRLQQRSFETREGEKRTVIEMQVDEVGPSLRYATAKVNRSQRGSASGGGFGADNGGGGGAPGGGGSGNFAPTDDPWASSGPAGGGAGGFSDEPPF
jgi:single-strand DNA-binding protein